MPYRICKTVEIESGHMLSKHPEKCRFPHGHTRTVEFVLEAGSLDERQMVCDFKVIKETMECFLDQYDHAMCVNTDDPMYPTLKTAYGDRVIGFDQIDPTTEVLAKTIYEHFKARLGEYANGLNPKYPIQADLKVVKVRVWETISSWAEYRP